MHQTYLLLGSNLGDCRENLGDALTRLEPHGTIHRRSNLYRSAAWGNVAQPDFLNVVVEFRTDLSPGQLLTTILGIEEAMGRERSEKWGPRLIDIDILFYDDLVMSAPDLVIPHPEIQNRRFTLVPLNEIASAMVHPVLNRTVAELLQECSDHLEVDPIDSQ
jgi:2-amino-4-hydroxy-6-hydroxymethyldihydropteridine diphosphokinase